MHTTVGPVGSSIWYEIKQPLKLTAKPKIQPIINRTPIREENSEPTIAGAIKKLNTSRMPAICTELVTTTPNSA